MSRIYVFSFIAFVLTVFEGAVWASFPKVPLDRQKFVVFSNPAKRAQSACEEAVTAALGVKSEVGCYVGLNVLSLARFASSIGKHSEGSEPSASFVTFSIRF